MLLGWPKPHLVHLGFQMMNCSRLDHTPSPSCSQQGDLSAVLLASISPPVFSKPEMSTGGRAELWNWSLRKGTGVSCEQDSRGIHLGTRGVIPTAVLGSLLTIFKVRHLGSTLLFKCLQEGQL